MIHPVDEFIGARIRTERLFLDMSQPDLAALIGVRFQQVQKYETGANRISGSRLWEVSQALDKPVETFFPSGQSELSRQDRLCTRANEVRLLGKIRRLDPETRRAVVALVEALSEPTAP